MKTQFRLLAVLAVVLLALAVLGGCGDSGGDDAGSGGESAATTPAGDAGDTGDMGGDTGEPAALAVGSEGVVGPYALTVTDVGRESKLSDPEGTYDTQVPGKGSEFLVVSVEFKNGTDSPWGVGPAYFALADSAGASYQAFPTNTGDFIFNMPQPIQPQSTVPTKIAYEIPRGTTGFTLVWTPSGEGITEPTSATYEFE